MTKRTSMSLAAALLSLALLAGCGGSGSKPSGRSTATGTNGSAQQRSGPATIATSSTGVGTVLVDGNGMTIYAFAKDTGPQSTCSGACAQHWPAVTTDGTPQAGSGVTASMLGTSRRSDGSVQVTYAGHPLYRFSGDSAAGDTNGQGVDAFGAKWYVVGTNGKTVQGTAPSGSSGSGGY